MSEKPNDQVQVITTDDLLKSIKSVAGVTIETVPAPEPKAAQIPAPKASAEAVRSAATEPLRKALDVAPMLSEIVTLFGDHQDGALEELRKHVQANTEFNLVALKAIESLKKSVDENTAAVKKYGETALPSKEQRPAGSVVILQKSADGTDKTEKSTLTPQQIRAKVNSGAEKLAKSMKRDAPELSDLTRQLSIFNAGGKVSERFVQDCLKAEGIAVQAPVAQQAGAA